MLLIGFRSDWGISLELIEECGVTETKRVFYLYGFGWLLKVLHRLITCCGRIILIWLLKCNILKLTKRGGVFQKEGESGGGGGGIFHGCSRLCKFGWFYYSDPSNGDGGGGGIHRVHPTQVMSLMYPQNCFYILSYNNLTHFQERFILGIQGCHCQCLFPPFKFICPIIITIKKYLKNNELERQLEIRLTSPLGLQGDNLNFR